MRAGAAHLLVGWSTFGVKRWSARARPGNYSALRLNALLDGLIVLQVTYSVQHLLALAAVKVRRALKIL